MRDGVRVDFVACVSLICVHRLGSRNKPSEWLYCVKSLSAEVPKWGFQPDLLSFWIPCAIFPGLVEQVSIDW